MDSIIAGIEKVFPETCINSDADTDLWENIQFIDSSICDIYYFGTSKVISEERYELLKKYDTPKDYTYYRSEEENKEDCADIIMISKKLKEQCSIFNLP